MELEEDFHETIKHSKMLGNTTFVVEDLEIDDPESREDFEAKVNFQRDRLWSIAPNAGAIVIAHQEDYDSEEGRIPMHSRVHAAWTLPAEQIGLTASPAQCEQTETPRSCGLRAPCRLLPSPDRPLRSNGTR